ncbi:hypothetical protein CAPTEDRAFT_223751 [Capitella teleta]|uniref:CUB domain-containing protein n=1 Tax=Capitella teleta TaxID=283909 RepID=R7T889_CAPTE|nr:hypothetical protein CAPTEDRAFT_223751 [Capitella teleta]|eukprot:ELT89889.1 hypothetical protein CAPTEDRAFT_223751 [Capitella teleta]
MLSQFPFLERIQFQHHCLIETPIEICETESFKASCPQNKVVVMTTARYGRMRIGRCVKKSLGYVGCFADVLPQADRRCSGLQDCEIRMPDPEFDRTAPCLEELKTYFEASFQCREVMQPPKPCSLGGDRWIISGLDHGTISNTVTRDTNCGTEQLPLEIRAFPGQRINITLYDFNTPYKIHQSMQYDDVTHVRCDEFVTVLDNHSKSTRKLCPGTHRISHGYTSTNDSLLVFFKKIPSAQESKKFLLEFKVIGCRDIVPPEGMYFTRTAEDAEIGCRRTSEVWSLACVQGRWKGEVGNCSSTFLPEILHGDPQVKKLPYGVTVGIILSLALVIGMVVLILGIIFLKRLQKGACADEMEDGGTGAVEMKRVHDQELHVCSHNFNLIAANPLEENLTKLHEDPMKDNPSNDYAPIKFHTFKASMLKQEDCREGLLAHDHVCPNKTVYFHPQVQQQPPQANQQYAYHAATSPRLVAHRFKEGDTVVHTCGKDRETSLYDRARFCSRDMKETSSVTLSRKPSFSMNNSF